MEHLKIVACSAIANLPLDAQGAKDTNWKLSAYTLAWFTAGIAAGSYLQASVSLTTLAIAPLLVDVAVLSVGVTPLGDIPGAKTTFQTARPLLRGIAAFTLFKAVQGLKADWTLLQASLVAIPTSIEVFGATAYSAGEQAADYFYST